MNRTFDWANVVGTKKKTGPRRWIYGIVSVAAAMMFSGPAWAQAGSAPKVPARQPLTHHHTGLYGWWTPYFWEGPFDFVIVQAFVLPHESLREVQNVSDAAHARAWNHNLRKARAAGKRVLTIVTPGQGQPTSKKYDEAFLRFLACVDVDELYAVILSEEHSVEAKRHEALIASYKSLKNRYPDLPVYQWYTNTERGEAQPGFRWPLLPADGWIINEIFADARDFEHEVRRYRMLGQPLIHLAWASPASDSESYPFQKSVFDGQLRVARKYDVPCAFYCPDDLVKRTFIWSDNAAEASKKVFKLVLEARKTARGVPEADLNDWDDTGRLFETVLEKGPDGQFAYRESFDLRTKVTGEKVPPRDFMERSLIVGLRHMTWQPDPSRIVVRAAGSGPVEVSLTNLWQTPTGESCRFTASAKVATEPGCKVIFEVSPNGYDWAAKAETITNGVARVDLPTAQPRVYTRLRVVGKSPAAAFPLAAIDWLEVCGRTSP